MTDIDLSCTRCKGTGEYTFKGFTSLEGKVYPDRTTECSSCKGSKVFQNLTEADERYLFERIRTTQGPNKGKLRLSFTSPYVGKCRDIQHYQQEVRAYYVWRLARFHGGKDVTMPMTADMLIGGDPLKKRLDQLADAVAKRCFGSNMIGANRWRRALMGE